MTSSTSFYNKYLLNDNKRKNNIDDINVLKKKYTFDYTDYEKLKINEQYNKLYTNIYNENKKSVEINENKKIYNLSLKMLATNTIKTSISLLNDLSIYFSKENNDKSINKLGYIITKDDNLLYVGILILILAFFLWIINVTR
jgi:ATP-dependent Zn protease